MHDVIIVLGAAVWPGGRPSPALRRRVAHAADLFKRGRADFLLVTGGLGKCPPSEARVMLQQLRAEGIHQSRVALEEEALTTFDSAVRCIALCRRQGWSSAIVVTDGYHLPRALLTFRALGMKTIGSAAANRLPAPRRSKQVQSHLREAVAIIWYALRLSCRRAMRQRP